MSLFWLFEIAFIVLYIVAFWKIFEKAGRAGWEGIIPIYNLYIMLKFVGKPGWWLIMLFIPFVNLIFAIWMANMLSKSFGKEEGFTIGLVLLGFIFYPILAFGDAQYKGPYGDPVAWKAANNPQFDFDSPQPQA